MCPAPLLYLRVLSYVAHQMRGGETPHSTWHVAPPRPRRIVTNEVFKSQYKNFGSSVGNSITRPTGLVAPNPELSRKITSILDGPCGALTSNRVGGVALRTSSWVSGESCGSGIANTVQFSWGSARRQPLRCRQPVRPSGWRTKRSNDTARRRCSATALVTTTLLPATAR
jgi:hypothetical protein